ncbi:UNVERIFIED_CONTAM: hypothetical protein GTU68_045304 [Idotea baltica]|nr:hypothetical protein [Idotea baltica]
MRFVSVLRLLSLFIICSFFVFFSLASVIFLQKIDLSRSFIALFCILLTLCLTIQRILVLKVLRFLRSKGYNFRNILIVGIDIQAKKLINQIVNRPELGVRVKAIASFENGNNNNYSELRKIVQEKQDYNIKELVTSVLDTEKVLNQRAIDEVIFLNFIDNSKVIKEVVDICTEQGVRTTIAANLFSLGLVKSGTSHFGDVPLIHFQPPPGDRWELSLKRFFDLIIATFSLILVSPLFIFLSLLIKLDSEGSIFFKQKRVGLNGRTFTLFKFRSMVQNAEDQLESLTNDPRITKVGKFIRKYSLDELPQLINVIKGEMSLVGPRPPIPGEVERYARRYRRRLSMRPGITCIWQISGRNEITDFENWLKLDLHYIDNWSLQNDFKILLKTIPAVVLGKGAS